MPLNNIKAIDPELYKLIRKEEKRQRDQLEMIPSENYASSAVLEALGTVLTNKYSEGYAGKRYYQGNDNIDKIEKLSVDRAKQLFNVPYANVQPHSGSPANSAVYFAILKPGDLIMGLKLSSGGHLTHGHPDVTLSGRFYKSIQYQVGEDGYLDYDEIEKLAMEHKPKIIVSGTTAYPRILDFKRFGNIADKAGAWHLADISHIAGLVAAGVHPSPVEYAHIVTLTTHKTMRGPRGAVILATDKGLAKDQELGVLIDKAIIPGTQGGPHNNTTAAIAICFKEAMSENFKDYSKQVVKNAGVLAEELKKFGFVLISNGTDNHLLLIDLNNKNIDGWCAAWALEYGGIVVNRNTVPFDKRSAFYPSGIRLGTPAITSRGMGESEMKTIAGWINEVINIAINHLSDDIQSDNKEKSRKARADFKKKIKTNKDIKRIADEVKIMCTEFPAPGLK